MRYLAFCVLAGWLGFMVCELRAARGEGTQPPKTTSSQDAQGAGQIQPAGVPSVAENQGGQALQNAGQATPRAVIDDGSRASQALREDPQERLRKTQLRLQEKYPFEDLRQRLAYEQRSEVYTTDPLEKPKRPPGTRFNPSLSERAETLRKLHHSTAREFISTPGFGLRRHPGPSSETILLLEPSGPLAADESPYRSDTLGPEAPFKLKTYEHEWWRGGESELDRVLTSGAPARVMFSEFNMQSKDIFVNADWLGYAESLDRAAGFLPHQFWQKPEIDTGPRAKPRNWNDTRDARQYAWKQNRYGYWRNTRLQLVSLLKHPEPRIYLSEHLPAMNELENAQTRELDDFEKAALAELRSAKPPGAMRPDEVVVKATTNTIRMLGPLRTEGNCADCHSVKAGSLLGAFSYVFERDRPIRADGTAEPPQVENRPVAQQRAEKTR